MPGRAKIAVGWCGACVLAMTSLAYAANDASLAAAVKRRDTQAVRMLLKQKANVNIPLPDGATALHWAAQWDDLDTAGLLIDSGARVNAPDDYGVTPLWLASLNGNSLMIAKLLKAGADANAALPTGETVLMTAARTGMVDAVNLLLERGVAVNAKESSHGQTALMWAAAEGHTDVVRALIKHGADVRARSEAGFTPLVLAARNASLETPKVLLAAGANVNEASSVGTTALVVATVRGHTSLAKFLLEQGADVNAGPGFGPLHWAAGDYSFAGVNGRMGLADENSEWSQLEGLKGQEQLDFIKLLLSHGANVNARADVSPRAELGNDGRSSVINTPADRRKFGGTPFWLAAKALDVDVMRLLVANGADPSILTNRHVTPLMAAAGVGAGAGSNGTPESKALEAVRLCLELGNDINVANVDGETALHGAAYRTPQPADNLIQFLVEKGANMNVKNVRGWTPLIIVEGLYFNGTHTLSTSAAALLRKLGAEPTPEGSVDRQVSTMNVGVVNR
jgi:uncharacterized protein